MIKIEGILTSFNEAQEVANEYGEKVFYPELLASALQSEKGDTVNILLSTDGGCVESAFEMYDMLRKSGKKIIITAHKAHSAGTIILLAGDEREVIKGSQALVHLPWSTLNMDVNSKILGQLYDLYRQEDLRLFKFYTERLNLSEEQRVKLWKFYENETILNASQMLEFGFANKVKEGEGVMVGARVRALAFNPVILNMVKSKTNKSEMANLKEKLKDILNSFKPKNASFEADDKTYYHDGELAVGTILYEDAEMTVEVQPVELTYEGRVYVIGEGGEVMEIRETTEDEIRFDEEMQGQILDVLQALKKENEQLKNEVSKLKALTVADKGNFRNQAPKAPEGNDFVARKAQEREFRRNLKNALNG